MNYNIVFAGVGGQGILTMANIIAIAALKEGYCTVQTETHGMSQRGGSVETHLRLSDHAIASNSVPKRTADLIVGLEPLEGLRKIEYLKEGGRFFCTNEIIEKNVATYPEINTLMNDLKNYYDITFFDLGKCVKEKNIQIKKLYNMIVLGAISSFIPIENIVLVSAIGSFFENKSQEIIQNNINAYLLMTQ